MRPPVRCALALLRALLRATLLGSTPRPLPAFAQAQWGLVARVRRGGNKMLSPGRTT
jgi:hypothetical protein